MLGRAGQPVLQDETFPSDEAYIRHKSSQVDVYQMRMFMRGIAILAALATLSLLYQFSHRPAESLYLIYALMAGVLAVWCWRLRFDDVVPDSGSPLPAKAGQKRSLGFRVQHLLISEGFLTAWHAYNRNRTVGSAIFVIWACYALGFVLWQRISERRRRAAEQALVVERQFPRL